MFIAYTIPTKVICYSILSWRKRTFYLDDLWDPFHPSSEVLATSSIVDLYQEHQSNSNSEQHVRAGCVDTCRTRISTVMVTLPNKLWCALGGRESGSGGIAETLAETLLRQGSTGFFSEDFNTDFSLEQFEVSAAGFLLKSCSELSPPHSWQEPPGSNEKLLSYQGDSPQVSESKAKQEIIIIKARDTPIGDKTMFGNQPVSFWNINFS